MQLVTSLQRTVEPPEFRGVLFEATQDKGGGPGLYHLDPGLGGLLLCLSLCWRIKRVMEYKGSCLLEARFSWQALLFILRQDGHASLRALPYLEALGGFPLQGLR